MAIPTKEEFEEYLKILADYKIDSLLDLLYRRNFDPDELMRIPEIQERIDCDGDREAAHTVAKWLSNDLGFHTAEEKLLQIMKQDRDEICQIEMKTVISELTEIFAEEHDPDYEKERITLDKNLIIKYVSCATAQLRHILWKKFLVSSLLEYHYSDTAVEMAKRRKQLPNEISKIQSAFSNFTDYLTKLHLYNPKITIHTQLHSQIKGLSISLENLHSQIEKRYPIKRIDQTSNLRLFVIRMSSFHLRFYSKKLADVITSLLIMKDIGIIKEVSDVEKLCVKSQKDGLLEERFKIT